MAIRFKGDYLIVDISYEELLKACLDTDFQELSVSKLIFEGVEKATGLKCNRGTSTCRNSELFLKLEEDIKNTSEYQEAKAKRVAKMKERNKLIAEAKRKEYMKRTPRYKKHF